MKIRLWGVRGSIPCPGPDTVEMGGNTACIELRIGEKQRIIIIDAGSGIRQLGDSMMQRDLPKGPMNIDLFITHTHWDHIMGFPFFTPIYIPGTKINVYGPVTYEDEGLDRIIGSQLQYRYFPVKQSELAAEITYHPLRECVMDLGDGITLHTKYLNHPILCLGYRFEHEGKVFCTVYDTEPFRNVFAMEPDDPSYDETVVSEGEEVSREENEKILKFFQNADLLIHDSQYTRQEYLKSKLGWGHSYFEGVINAAHKADVKKLLLFHHDPLRTDKQLNTLLEDVRERVEGRSSLEIDLAKEGMELEI